MYILFYSKYFVLCTMLIATKPLLQSNNYLQYFRLSENNCVEIINKLLEKKLLDIYFTTNGKEYITPSHLTKEIKEELYLHRGILYKLIK